MDRKAEEIQNIFNRSLLTRREFLGLASLVTLGAGIKLFGSNFLEHQDFASDWKKQTDVGLGEFPGGKFRLRIISEDKSVRIKTAEGKAMDEFLGKLAPIPHFVYLTRSKDASDQGKVKYTAAKDGSNIAVVVAVTPADVGLNPIWDRNVQVYIELSDDLAGVDLTDPDALGSAQRLVGERIREHTKNQNKDVVFSFEVAGEI